MTSRRFRALVAPLPLVSLAALAGVVAPSEELARRSDLILAALVLAVAMTIEPSRLRVALRRRRLLAAAVLAPFVILLPLAFALGRAFAGPERDGLLALGLASSEVAAAALVGLAAGDAALALTVVAFSLVASAIAAPVLAPVLGEGRVDTAEVVIRFSLVVVVPLVVGLLVRARSRGEVLARYGELGSVVILALLVYASLGDLGSLSDLGAAALAALAFPRRLPPCRGRVASRAGRVSDGWARLLAARLRRRCDACLADRGGGGGGYAGGLWRRDAARCRSSCLTALARRAPVGLAAVAVAAAAAGLK